MGTGMESGFQKRSNESRHQESEGAEDVEVDTSTVAVEEGIDKSDGFADEGVGKINGRGLVVLGNGLPIGITTTRSL